MKEYDFWEDHERSENPELNKKVNIIVQKVLKTKTIKKSTKEENILGVDWWHDNYGVDLKFRSEDYGNVSIEPWSSIGYKPGWTWDPHKISDIICYYWKDTGRYMILDYVALRKLTNYNLTMWMNKYWYHITYQRHKDYLSSCIHIPNHELLDCTLFHGNVINLIYDSCT